MYLNDSNWYVGKLPDGTVKFYCQESDYWEEVKEYLGETEEEP